MTVVAYKVARQIIAIGGFAIIAPLVGCATMPIPVGIPCSVGPVVLDKGASTRLTRSEKEQIVVVNTTGEKLCAWRHP